MDSIDDIRDAVMNRFTMAKPKSVEEKTNPPEQKTSGAESSKPQQKGPVKERQKKDLGLPALAEVLQKQLDRGTLTYGSAADNLNKKRDRVTERVDTKLVKGLVRGLGR